MADRYRLRKSKQRQTGSALDGPDGLHVEKRPLRFGPHVGFAFFRAIPPTGLFLFLAAFDLMPVYVAIGLGFFAFLYNLITYAFAVREFDAVISFLRRLSENPHFVPAKPKVRQELSSDMLKVGLQLHQNWVERELRQRDFLFSRERVFDAIPDPMFLLRADGLVVGANTAAHRFFRRDLIGQPISSFLRDPDILDAVENAAGKGAGGSVTWHLLETVERIFDVQIVRLPASERQETMNIMVAMHEITALKRLEKMRADFVANASHELRTPLASLIGFTETLAGSAHDDVEARDSFLPIMLEQGRRMQRLVDDLLSLSRIELLAHSAPRDPVDLLEAVTRVSRGLDLLASQRNVTMQIEADADLPQAMGDRNQVIQVFQNLLDNALKYGHKGVPVVVRLNVVEKGPLAMPLALRAPCLCVAISNEGDLIPKDHLPRLTERFYRADKARSRMVGGTGLGLAIVKHIMMRHRGALVIEGRPTGGLTTAAYFPIYKGDQAGGSCPDHDSSLTYARPSTLF